MAFDFFNFAYLDPGTGSLIIQSVIGVIAGVAVFGRNAVHNVSDKVKQLLTKSTKPGAEAKAEAEAEPRS